MNTTLLKEPKSWGTIGRIEAKAEEAEAGQCSIIYTRYLTGWLANEGYKDNQTMTGIFTGSSETTSLQPLVWVVLWAKC